MRAGKGNGVVEAVRWFNEKVGAAVIGADEETSILALDGTG